LKAFARTSPGLASIIVSVTLEKSADNRDYYFDLFKKITNEARWVKIKSQKMDTEIEDFSIYENLKPGVSISYKVEVRLISDASLCDTLYCIAEFGDYNKYAFSAEVNYNRYLKATNAPFFKIFHVAMSGDRCSCWDSVREEASDVNCSECNGTGFSSGIVYVGRERFIVLNSNKAESLVNEEVINGISKPSPTQSWTTGKYIIKPGYIIIREPNATMYEIMTVNPSIISDVVVRQEIAYREIEQGSAAYAHIASKGRW
jgi:hypothetical protein